MDNDELMEVNPYFKHVLMEKGLYSDALMKRIVQELSLIHI